MFRKIFHDFIPYSLSGIFFAVDKNGDVCISILHEPGEDKYGYEKPEERWLPIHTVETIMISVISMLADPNGDSPANVDAAVSLMWMCPFKLLLVLIWFYEIIWMWHTGLFQDHLLMSGWATFHNDFLIFQKEWREDRHGEFKRKVARCVRKSQETAFEWYSSSSL